MGKHGSNKPNQEGISAQNKIRSLSFGCYIPETKRKPQENAFLDLVSYYGNLPGAGMSNFVLVFDHNLRKQGEMEDGIKPRSSTCLSLPLLIWLIDPTLTACLILVIKAHSWSTDNKPMDYKLLRPAQGLIAIFDLIASRQISIRQGLGVRVLNSERCPSWITEPIIKANLCYPRVYHHDRFFGLYRPSYLLLVHLSYGGTCHLSRFKGQQPFCLLRSQFYALDRSVCEADQELCLKLRKQQPNSNFRSVESFDSGLQQCFDNLCFLFG
ncbi:hypothetical protein VNO77_21358 [Canavalia gladiata]|uniref:Uncharacterized protein n=1 Tax=Canavalia gladiata TaxID=3824 RepID=A0AAN9LR84_CANGL